MQHSLAPLIEPYSPPLFFKNCHLQNILSSIGIRKRQVYKQHCTFIESASEQIIDSGTGVRLKVEFNRHKNPASQAVILLHGWEGSSQSAYILSLSAHLFSQGFDTIRVNMRDHGGTTHLNKEIFNSTLIDEVVGVISTIQKESLYQKYDLAGFSLGGNFSLRVGLQNSKLAKPLHKIVAVSPVLDPARTMLAMENTISFYDRYFTYKWKRSLKEKATHFPEYKSYSEDLKKLRNLREMNSYFIPQYTRFDNVDDYFRAYTITGDVMKKLSVDTLILSGEDDPIIPAADFANTYFSESTEIELSKYGAHCAFLENWKLDSWIDKRATHWLKS